MDEEQLALLLQGVGRWNLWREQHPSRIIHLWGVSPSDAILERAQSAGALLSGARLSARLAGVNLSRARLNWADLYQADLTGANLSGADLDNAFLIGANLTGADLREADLTGANLTGADLTEADLSGADLTWADLTGANLTRTDLSRADLRRANLQKTRFIQTKLGGAKLQTCRVYGLSAWNVEAQGSEPSHLIITPSSQPIITVDNLQVAQIVSSLLNSSEMRAMIGATTLNVVLLLCRFARQRAHALNAILIALRQRGYLPVTFDFDKPSTVHFMEMISVLVSMSRFVIVDITDAKSVPSDLYRLITAHPSKPVQPILLKTRPLPVLDLAACPTYLPLYEYMAEDAPSETLIEKVIAPAERMIGR